MPRKPHAPRNSFLVRGITRFSRSTMFSKKGRWAKKNKKAVAPKSAETKPVVKQFGKKGETRTIQPRTPRYYPTEDIKKPIYSSKTQRPARLRASIKPGQVLILLIGKFRGKRVVFLKQLPSGLLLVTGPFKFNGVPLRRVSQAYTIATSTRIDVSAAKLDNFNDDYFKKPKDPKAKKSEAEFFAQEKKKTEKKKPAEKRLADQKAVDNVVIEAVKKVSYLKSYLK